MSELNEKLLEAVENNSLKAIKSLIKEGADVNATNRNDDTALMYAAYKGDKQTGELLIENGADVDAINKNGYTALMYAKNNRHEEVIKLLTKEKKKNK